MSWPQSQEYNEAIQSPTSSFADPELRTGQVVTNDLGLLMPRSGNFADVYEVRCPNGTSWAVKCFTREVAGLRERYQEISRSLQQAQLPFTVEFSYLEQGLRLRGAWYPILKMQWVEGFTLNDFIRQQLDKPAMLGGLLQIWGRMATRLRASGIAHADLQHGNVLLVPGRTADSVAVKLIDYDGMFVSSLAHKKSGEVGHPSYQHPQRLREGIYNQEVDRFPLLLIATALRALRVKGKPLWEKYDNGDNLLFRQQDLEAPHKSALFSELLKLPEPADRSLVEQLIDSARQPLGQTPLLDDLLPEARPSVVRVWNPSSAPPVRPKTAVVVPVAVPVAAALSQTATPQADARASQFAFDGQKTEPVVSGTRRASKRRPKSSSVLLYLVGGAVLAGVLLLAGVVGLGVWAFSGGKQAKENTGQPEGNQQASTGLNAKDKDVKEPPNNKAATVVLKNLPTDASVTIDGDPVTVKRGSGKSSEVRVDPGKKHRLVVKKDGFEDFGEEVELNAGGRKSVVVQLTPTKVPFQDLPKTVRVDLGEGVKMEFVLIDPKSKPDGGKFKMGSPTEEKGRNYFWTHGFNVEKQHEVEITKPFYLAKYPTTQEQYKALMGKNPSYFNGVKARLDTNQCPVEQVSPQDADDCCKEMMEKCGAQIPAALKQTNYRFALPTEAQWEYACRAGSKTAYYFGDDPMNLGEYAWFGENSGSRTHPVGEKKPNEWGLYDMCGNVYQWCADWYGEYPNEAVTDPQGPTTGSTHVYRGGGWYNAARFYRSADRATVLPPGVNRSHYVGFRVAFCAEKVEPMKTGADKPMPSAPMADGFVPLFNDKDLTGWKTHLSQPGNWRVEKRILIGSSDGVSHLYTDRSDYTNFHLRLEARLNEGDGFRSTGVYFRAPFGPTIPVNKPTWVGAYNAKIDARRLGGLLIDLQPELHRTRESILQPGEWTAFEIIAEGNRVIIKVNGETTCDYTDEQKLYTKGHIVLQQHGAATVVEFRKIEIKELSESKKTDEKPLPTETPSTPPDEPDPIRVNLDKAKADYEAVWTKQKKSLLESLDKLEEKERKAGNKDHVDQIKAEREAFENSELLPLTVSTKDYQQHMYAAHAAIDLAFKGAITVYTRKKLDAKADAVEKEKKSFEQTHPADAFQAGTVWKGKLEQVWTGSPNKGISDFTLTVLERDGKTFKAKVEVGNAIREVRGTINKGVLGWLAQDVQAIRGNQGPDHVGGLVGSTIVLRFQVVTAPNKTTSGVANLQFVKQ